VYEFMMTERSKLTLNTFGKLCITKIVSCSTFLFLWNG